MLIPVPSSANDAMALPLMLSTPAGNVGRGGGIAVRRPRLGSFVSPGGNRRFTDWAAASEVVDRATRDLM